MYVKRNLGALRSYALQSGQQIAGNCFRAAGNPAEICQVASYGVKGLGRVRSRRLAGLGITWTGARSSPESGRPTPGGGAAWGAPASLPATLPGFVQDGGRGCSPVPRSAAAARRERQFSEDRVVYLYRQHRASSSRLGRLGVTNAPPIVTLPPGYPQFPTLVPGVYLPPPVPAGYTLERTASGILQAVPAAGGGAQPASAIQQLSDWFGKELIAGSGVSNGVAVGGVVALLAIAMVSRKR